MGCNLHTFWDDDPVCTECGYRLRRPLPPPERVPLRYWILAYWWQLRDALAR